MPWSYSFGVTPSYTPIAAIASADGHHQGGQDRRVDGTARTNAVQYEGTEFISNLKGMGGYS